MSDSPLPAPRKATSPGSRLLHVVASLAAMGTVIVVLFTVCGFAARWWWRFDQVCHFRVQYFWMLTIAAAVLLAAKRTRLAQVAAAVAIVNLVVIVPVYWPPWQPHIIGPSLRVVSFNLFSHNSQQHEVLTFLREQKADVVLLMEVSLAWADAIETLHDVYPYQHVVSRSDNFGIAMLSRLPWENVQTLELGSSGLPSIAADLADNGGNILILGTHPLPPGSRELTELRNEQLVAVAQFIRAHKRETILVGDLNTTNFSPSFRDLLHRTGLSDSRRGYGVQASWGPFPGLEIAIDHALVSPGFAVTARRVGPHLGSDHRPLIVDLRWPRSSE
jgi:endonuclease/exonuclease/phosphatase (EEP) superfamily protein YafD